MTFLKEFIILWFKFRYKKPDSGFVIVIHVRPNHINISAWCINILPEKTKFYLS